MTHKELVDKAKHWLSISQGCNPVFCERGSSKLSEMPDAIGWTSKNCIIVECKASIADLKADLKKSFRHDDSGLGNLRYYLIHKELFEQNPQLSILDGWGLVIVSDNNSSPSMVRGYRSKEHKRNIDKENMFLRSRILEIQRFGR